MTTRLMVMSPGFAVRTDVGRRREQNEDRYLARPPLFAVADGLGGHEAGEVAASMAIDHLDRAAGDRQDPSSLKNVLRAANRSIRAAQQDPARAGMGTTCTVLWLSGGSAHIAHVGDSRAYQLRNGMLRQLTDDHTYVAEMVREGVLAEADAQDDDRRHVLTHALGSGQEVRIDIMREAVEPGDRYLLCTDGLSGQVVDVEIAAVLRREGDPGMAADELIKRANAAGGADNVTIVIVDIDALSAAAPPGPTLTRSRSAASAPSRSAFLRGLAILVGVALLGGAIVIAAISGAPPAPVPSPTAFPESRSPSVHPSDPLQGAPSPRPGASGSPPAVATPKS